MPAGSASEVHVAEEPTVLVVANLVGAAIADPEGPALGVDPTIAGDLSQERRPRVLHRSGQVEGVEQGRDEVDVGDEGLAAALESVRGDPPVFLEPPPGAGSRVDEERDTEPLLEHLPVATETRLAVAESLAVVGGDDDDRAVQQPAIGPLGEPRPEPVVHVSDPAVVEGPHRLALALRELLGDRLEDRLRVHPVEDHTGLGVEQGVVGRGGVVDQAGLDLEAVRVDVEQVQEEERPAPLQRPCDLVELGLGELGVAGAPVLEEAAPVAEAGVQPAGEVDSDRGGAASESSSGIVGTFSARAASAAHTLCCAG